MSFYWQQALSNNDPNAQHQSVGQATASQGGTWDYISLGSGPAQQQSWGYQNVSTPSNSQTNYASAHQQPQGNYYPQQQVQAQYDNNYYQNWHQQADSRASSVAPTVAPTYQQHAGTQEICHTPLLQHQPTAQSQNVSQTNAVSNVPIPQQPLYVHQYEQQSYSQPHDPHQHLYSDEHRQDQYATVPPTTTATALTAPLQNLSHIDTSVASADVHHESINDAYAYSGWSNTDLPQEPAAVPAAGVRMSEDGSNVSSQTTPESGSGYSVDTFGTTESSRSAELVEPSACEPGTDAAEGRSSWDVEWETSDKTALPRLTPDEISQSQSEPIGYAQSVSSVATLGSRESSVSHATPVASTIENRSLDALAKEEPVVAQVAPLQVKKTVKQPIVPEAEPIVARVDPVVNATEQTNVQRVAPTPQTFPFPAREVVPIVEEPVVEVAPVVQQPPVEQDHVEGVVAAQETQHVQSPRASANELSVPIHERTADVVTPETPANETDRLASLRTDSLGEDSPGIAQATSTPIAGHDADERPRVASLSLENSPQVASSSSPRGTKQPSPKPSVSADAVLTEKTKQDVRRQVSAEQLAHDDAQRQAQQPGDLSDHSQNSLARNDGARLSYRNSVNKYREQYPEMFKKIEKYRTQTFRGESRNGRVSNVANPIFELNNSTSSQHGGRRLYLGRGSTNSNNISMDGSYIAANERMNISHQSQQDTGHNFSQGFGEDFVDASRRSRLSRNRPGSRAMSEIGEQQAMRNTNNSRSNNSFAERPAPAYGMYPQHHVHPGYYTTGRQSVAHTNAEYYGHRGAYLPNAYRAQSVVDPRAFESYQQGGYRDAYAPREAYEDDDRSSSTGDSDEEEHESEDEMKQYAPPPGYGARPHPSMSGYSLNSSMRMPPPPSSSDSYYFGVVHLDPQRVNGILRNDPPPNEYYNLPPIEKAAFLFYSAIHKKHYSNVTGFHSKFNREFYKYICEGDTEVNALWKICRSMQDEYHAKRVAIQQKAYDASQRMLFSDERESIDGHSDLASVNDEKFDEQGSDVQSVDSSNRAPLKHRTPHAFVTFGAGGRMVCLQPDVSTSVVQIDDIKIMLKDRHSKKIMDTAQAFRGPLIAGKTPSHSVLLYIQRQMERIRNCEVAMENPRAHDVVDCLLVWQLLEMVVQQQGRVTGPDIARLLIAAGSSSSLRASHHREKSITPSVSDASVLPPNGRRSPNPAAHNTESKVYEHFTQYLLGGHIDEAIECALRGGLYADALVLARRLFAGDAKRLAEIEERFLATRTQCSPVMTLVSVASEQPAPILTNPPKDDVGSWRTHVAIVLANLNTSTAMNTVYHLGRVLAKRECDAGADFCMLAVALLARYDPFQPVAATADDDGSRQHISLVHAEVPNDDMETRMCRFGFSLTDLHATEIFDFAMQLSGVASPLSSSIEYQKRRFQYAQLLSDYGGFATDSFRYCMEVARSIWGYYNQFSHSELHQLCDLADRLQYSASADASETTWIPALRQLIAGMPVATVTPALQPEQHQPMAETHQQPMQTTHFEPTSAPAVDPQPVPPPMQAQPAIPDQTMHSHPESYSSAANSEQILSAAQQWHESNQAPLEMFGSARPPSPPVVSQPTPVLEPIVQEPARESRSRSQSNAPQQEYSYGDESSYYQQQHQQSHYSAASHNGYYEDDSTSLSTSEQTSSSQTSPDGTPVRTQRPRAPSVEVAPQYVPQQSFAAPAMAPLPIVPTPAAQPSSQSQPSPKASAEPTPIQNGAPLPAGNFKNKGNSGSFLGRLVKKMMPAPGDEMRLPDDKNKTIRFENGRWVGEGVEEEVAPPPPPAAVPSMPASTAAPDAAMGAAAAPPAPGGGFGGLKSARSGGGSRYLNPLAGQSSGAAPSVPSAMPAMPIPSSFSFIPTMPDDSESVDPFSGEANPTLHGLEQTDGTKAS